MNLSPVNDAVETMLLRARTRWERCSGALCLRRGAMHLRRPELRNALFVVLFVVTVWLGRLTMHAGTQIALIWPAAGVGVLWMLPLVRGERWWRRRATWVAMGLLGLAAAGTNLVAGMPLHRSLGFGIANVVQALVTACWFVRGRGRVQLALTTPPRLHRLLLAAVLGAVASLPFGPGLQVVTAGASPASLWQYVVRNVVSVFLVGLAGMLLGTHFRTRLHRPSYAGRLAGITLTSLLLLWLVFAVPGAMLLFVLIPLGMLVAYWTDPRTTAWHTLAVSGALIVAAVSGVSPLRDHDLTVEATIVQAVVLVLSVVSMTLVLDREQQAHLLAEIEASRLATLSQAQLMERLIFSIGEGVILVGSDGDVMVSNPAARRLVGIEEPQSFGDVVRLPSFLYDAGPADVAADDAADAGDALRHTGEEGHTEGAGDGGPIARALGGCPVPPTDVHVAGPGDGDPLVLAVTASPVETYEGTQAVVLVRDVTREREHTAELSRFAGVVAHDLLNPVTSIRAWSEVVGEELQDAGTPSLLPMVGRITGSARRMQQLIDDLLDYSVTRRGHLQLGSVYVGRLVDEIVHAGAYGDDVAAPTQHPDLRVNAPHPVEADAAALRQVLTNLIGNAVKYSAPGTRPTIEIGTEALPGNLVRISVADRGIGVPHGQEQQIFQELYRVPDHASAYPGTGLGLAICRRIAERHGGTIEALRREGGGTVFELTLPAMAACCSGGSTACADCSGDRRPGDRGDAVA